MEELTANVLINIEFAKNIEKIKTIQSQEKSFFFVLETLRYGMTVLAQ